MGLPWLRGLTASLFIALSLFSFAGERENLETVLDETGSGLRDDLIRNLAWELAVAAKKDVAVVDHFNPMAQEFLIGLSFWGIEIEKPLFDELLIARYRDLAVRESPDSLQVSLSEDLHALLQLPLADLNSLATDEMRALYVEIRKRGNYLAAAADEIEAAGENADIDKLLWRYGLKSEVLDSLEVLEAAWAAFSKNDDEVEVRWRQLVEALGRGTFSPRLAALIRMDHKFRGRSRTVAVMADLLLQETRYYHESMIRLMLVCGPHRGLLVQGNTYDRFVRRFPGRRASRLSLKEDSVYGAVYMDCDQEGTLFFDTGDVFREVSAQTGGPLNLSLLRVWLLQCEADEQAEDLVFLAGAQATEPGFVVFQEEARALIADVQAAVRRTFESMPHCREEAMKLVLGRGMSWLMSTLECSPRDLYYRYFYEESLFRLILKERYLHRERKVYDNCGKIIRNLAMARPLVVDGRFVGADPAGLDLLVTGPWEMLAECSDHQVRPDGSFRMTLVSTEAERRSFTLRLAHDGREVASTAVKLEGKEDFIAVIVSESVKAD